jgi:hypothetical protein
VQPGARGRGRWLWGDERRRRQQRWLNNECNERTNGQRRPRLTAVQADEIFAIRSNSSHGFRNHADKIFNRTNVEKIESNLRPWQYDDDIGIGLISSPRGNRQVVYEMDRGEGREA